MSHSLDISMPMLQEVMSLNSAPCGMGNLNLLKKYGDRVFPSDMNYSSIYLTFINKKCVSKCYNPLFCEGLRNMDWFLQVI